MTTYYFDWDNGDDANNGTSSATPKKSYDAFTSLGAAGDRFLFRRGTTQVISTIYKTVRSGTASARSYYGVYGTGAFPYVKFVNPTGIGGMCVNFGGRQYIDVEDIYFDGTNCSNAVYAAAQSANDAAYLVFRRCTFANASTNGLSMTRESTATGTAHDNVIEYCKGFNNGSHGIYVSGTNCLIRYNKCFSNGATNSQGGHGISLQYKCTDVTSGWTLTGAPGGTTYSRSVNAAETSVYRVTAPYPYGYMAENTATPTTPGIGEWGFVAGSPGTLYVNINSVANGVSIRYAWGLCRYNTIEFNECWNNIYNPNSLYHEGHGIALDDFTSDSVVRGNFCHDNQGLGLSNNRGNNNLFYGNIAIRNWQSGFTANPCLNVKVINNTFFGNNSGNGAHDAEINFNYGCTTGVISNNILIAGSTTGSVYGIDVDPASTGFTGATNYIYGYTTATRTGTYTGTTTTDIRSYLDAQGNLKSLVMSSGSLVANPLRNVGTYIQGVSLINDRTKPGFTPVGASQVGRV